ncbi:hypothetical protein GCM10022403_064610 [Streptomyces coacervatus]|uniref:Uncharacterized protein n=1 Tax=Streptomyces coacervatus TaxID=647381 RepID=A0ABP7IMV9_9ACTN
MGLGLEQVRVGEFEVLQSGAQAVQGDALPAAHTRRIAGDRTRFAAGGHRRVGRCLRGHGLVQNGDQRKQLGRARRTDGRRVVVEAGERSYGTVPPDGARGCAYAHGPSVRRECRRS